nr:u6 snrna phosphodiesterase [Quercus suber]
MLGSSQSITGRGIASENSMTALVSYESSDDDDGEGAVQAVVRPLLAREGTNAPDDDQAKELSAEDSRSDTVAVDMFLLNREHVTSTVMTKTIPSLPASFLDLYSSTVRTSTSDAPSLHGGRKRVTPHVAGNWAGHIYTEWYPEPQERKFLARLISTMQDIAEDGTTVHSLLENELNVPLPLHISLSRPMSLQTGDKDVFVSSVRAAIASSGVMKFTVKPFAMKWHANESQVRWFLVLQLDDCVNNELDRLLCLCNKVARRFDQAELYSDRDQGKSQHSGTVLQKAASLTEAKSQGRGSGQFHVSIAWSLNAPITREGLIDKVTRFEEHSLFFTWQNLQIPVDSIKIRLGQDIVTIPLTTPRAKRVLSA